MVFVEFQIEPRPRFQHIDAIIQPLGFSKAVREFRDVESYRVFTWAFFFLKGLHGFTCV